jgi:RimJ/RimL family protein N-acetyltransferase
MNTDDAIEGTIPPERIWCERILLQRWSPADAPRLQAALDAAWDDLQRWIPWVFPERQAIPELEERLQGYQEDFLEGRNALYAILSPDEAQVLGGAGLYRRVGPAALEIGYWVRSDRSGEGIATEAAAALTRAGLELPGIDRLEIRCDPEHAASAAIPRKLGYCLREIIPADHDPSGDRGGGTMVWEMEIDASSGMDS